MTITPRSAGALVVAAALLALTGCSGGGGGDQGSSAGSSGSYAAADSAARAAEPAADRQAAPKSRGAIQRAVISTGSVALSSRNVGTAHDAVVGIVSRYGGTVAQDDTSVDDHGRAASSDLTVRVPADDFAAAMTALKGLGRLTSAGQSTEDVTTQVIDTRVRVRAQQRSLRRMERLFDSAASVATVLRIENALTRRQADLDSLLRQQAYLADQTALATITVSITRSEPLTVADRAGFLGGLAKGWNSLVGALALALTALGVLLPWVLAASVVGLPLALLVRRHRQTTTDAA